MYQAWKKTSYLSLLIAWIMACQPQQTEDLSMGQMLNQRVNPTKPIALSAKQQQEIADHQTPSIEAQNYAARVCADGEVTLGIDVSRWQGDIDWAAVSNDGVKYAIIRVSDGTQAIDRYFEANWAGAQQHGILRSVYQFFRPNQDPIEQANILIAKVIANGPTDLPPVIDVEADDGASQAAMQAAVLAWLNHVEAALGMTPIIYTGKYFWQDHLATNSFNRYPLWVAQYPFNASCLREDDLRSRLSGGLCPDLPNNAWSDWAFWQYSSSGCVAGIDGNVDMNLFNGTYDQLLALTAPPVCGDGRCSGNENNNSCAQDCPICEPIPAEGKIIDDTDLCFTGGGDPATIRIVNDAGFNGNLKWTYSWVSNTPDNYGLWNFKFAEAGEYLIEAYTAQAYSEWDETPYQIRHQGQEQTVMMDQTAVDGWQTLGTFSFAQGGDQWIRINDNVVAQDVKRKIVFDAIRITRNLPPPQDMMITVDTDLSMIDQQIIEPTMDMALPIEPEDRYVSPITLDLGPSVFVDARVMEDLNIVEGESQAKGDSGCQAKQGNQSLWGFLFVALLALYSKAFRPVSARPTAKV
jgi:lysozyme